MPCNLNFNQCNTGCKYPRPIFTCYRNIIALLNQSGNQIVNPTIESSRIIGNISSSQTIASLGNVVPTIVLNQGSAIAYDNAGTFTLVNGRYLITFDLSETYAADGNYNFAVYKDGVVIPGSSVNSSGTVGNASSVSKTVYVEVTNPNSQITIRNTNVNSQVVNSGSVVIQKLV